MKKTLLISTATLLTVAPIATVISCNEVDPAIHTWAALSDGILNVTMEAEYPPYNFAIDTATYKKIEKQSSSTIDYPDDNGLSPEDAKNWIKMILPIDKTSPAYDENTPYIGGIDPFIAQTLAKKMSTQDKTIKVSDIYVQDWDKIKEGWAYDPNLMIKDDDGNDTNEHMWPTDDSGKYDIIISAMAPDNDKKPKHTFTNEYLLTENVIAKRYDIDPIDAKTIATWKTLSPTQKAKFGKIAVEKFPDSDPEGKNNVAVKYFGIDYVEQKSPVYDKDNVLVTSSLDRVYEAITNVENKYAFIEDIQAEELKQRSRGTFDYIKGLFPNEPFVKSAMSVKPGTGKFVLNHINNYLFEEITLVEQNWLKFTSIKMSAYCNPKI